MKIGDIVTRKSYNNDIIFIILEINDEVAKLKGKYIRLYADAPVSDLELSEDRDDYNPDYLFKNMDRDEFFYMPGKILHIDGDPDYLKKSLDFYKKCGVLAVGKLISEKDMPDKIMSILETTKPDVLVITGHDAFYGENKEIDNISKYKNSIYFAKTVSKAREYESSHEKLVIVAGACQSDYEDIIKSGANYASSPKRVNIHALDPAVIAANVALTDKSEKIDIKNLLSKTKYGKNGLGGILGNGMMYVGYPR